MPGEHELAAMWAFVEEKQFSAPGRSLYPLITYWGVMDGEVSGDQGIHQGIAALAMRHGIPPAFWPRHLVNLHARRSGDFDNLRNLEWLPSWNGVWIHHDIAQAAAIDGGLFYITYARHILAARGFDYGLLSSPGSCAPRKGGRSSFLEELCAMVPQPTRIFGLQSESWVPLEGPCWGRVLVAPVVFHDWCLANDESLWRYFNCLFGFVRQAFEQRDPDRLLPYLTENYYDEAQFHPGRVKPMAPRPESPRGDIHWYGTI